MLGRLPELPRSIRRGSVGFHGPAPLRGHLERPLSDDLEFLVVASRRARVLVQDDQHRLGPPLAHAGDNRGVMRIMRSQRQEGTVSAHMLLDEDRILELEDVAGLEIAEKFYLVTPDPLDRVGSPRVAVAKRFHSQRRALAVAQRR